MRQSRDRKDILAGVVIMALGLAIMGYSLWHYELGTFRQMGRGMFPTGLGILLGICGLVILVPAIFREGTKAEVQVRPAFAIIGSVVAFALAVDSFGMVPAIIVMTSIAVFADSRLGLIAGISLGILLAGMSYLIFGMLLNMTIAFFNWPF